EGEPVGEAAALADRLVAGERAGIGGIGEARAPALRVRFLDRGAADLAQPIVEVGRAAGRIEAEDADRRDRREAAREMLALAQRVLEPLQVADVGERADHAAVRGVGLRAGLEHDPRRRSVRARLRELDAAGAARKARLAVAGDDALEVAGVERTRPAAPEQLGARAARDLRGLPVHVDAFA